MLLLGCSMACRWISALLTPCLWPHCAVNTECGFHCLLPSHSPQHPIAFGHGEVKLAQAAWQEQCQISPFAWGARVEICVGCVWVLLGVGPTMSPGATSPRLLNTPRDSDSTHHLPAQPVPCITDLWRNHSQYPKPKPAPCNTGSPPLILLL